MSYPIMPVMPLSMAKGLKKTPNFDTVTQKNAAGVGNSAISLKPYPTWDFEFSMDRITGNEALVSSVVAEFLGTYMQCNGQASLFLFTDPQDNTVTNMNFGTGTGTTVAFQLSRTIAGIGVDVIQNPVVSGSPPTPHIYVNGVLKISGVDYNIGPTGVVTFVSAPANNAVLTWTGSFYYLCRFDSDTVDSTRSFTTNSGTDQWDIASIKFSSEFVSGASGSVQASAIPATPGVVVSGTPSANQILTATSSVAADWQSTAILGSDFPLPTVVPTVLSVSRGTNSAYVTNSTVLNPDAAFTHWEGTPQYQDGFGWFGNRFDANVTGGNIQSGCTVLITNTFSATNTGGLPYDNYTNQVGLGVFTEANTTTSSASPYGINGVVGSKFTGSGSHTLNAIQANVVSARPAGFIGSTTNNYAVGISSVLGSGSLAGTVGVAVDSSDNTHGWLHGMWVAATVDTGFSVLNGIAAIPDTAFWGSQAGTYGFFSGAGISAVLYGTNTSNAPTFAQTPPISFASGPVASTSGASSKMRLISTSAGGAEQDWDIFNTNGKVLDFQYGGADVLTVSSTGALAVQGTGASVEVIGSVGNATLDSTGAALAFNRASANYILASASNGYLSFRVNGNPTGTMVLTAAGVLELGLTGTSSGEVLMFGSTSGSCTITAPAVASTTTNPIVFSNCIQTAAGTVANPAHTFTGATTTGMYLLSSVGSPPSNGLGFSVNGVLRFGVEDNGIVVDGHENSTTANSDTNGSVSSVSGTTVSKVYASTYTSAPTVTVTPTTNAGAFYLSASSKTGFTVTYATSGAQTFNYHVDGNPN